MYIYDIPHYYPKFNVLTVLKSQGSVNFPACLWHLVLTYHTNIYHFTKQNIQGLQRSAGPGYEMLWAEIDAVRNRFFSSKILRLLHKYKKHHEVPKHSETTPNQTQLSERICPNHQIAPYYKKKTYFQDGTDDIPISSRPPLWISLFACSWLWTWDVHQGDLPIQNRYSFDQKRS